LIVQNETALGRTRWVTVCPITSSLTGATTIRVPIDPGEGSGLVKQSEIEVDLIFPVKFVSIDRAIGQVSSATMRMVDAALKRWLDL
jgi:mRNA interferase MazF